MKSRPYNVASKDTFSTHLRTSEEFKELECQNKKNVILQFVWHSSINVLMFHIITIIICCEPVVTEYEGKELIWANVCDDIIKVTFVCEDKKLEEY